MVNDITYLVHSTNQSNTGYRKGVMHGSGFVMKKSALERVSSMTAAKKTAYEKTLGP